MIVRQPNEGLHRRPIKAWVSSLADIEASAFKQLDELAQMPFIAPNGVAVMPDVHAGIGSTVGTVIATDRAIIPAAVGVDIGCGMIAVRTSLRADQLPDSLSALRHQIERDIPVGFNQYTRNEDIDANWNVLLDKGLDGWMSDVNLDSGTKKIGIKDAKVAAQLGTLGGGNHFIEVCLDLEDRVWIMLHSGSRGTGNAIGRYFIDAAKELMIKDHIALPNPDLAYLPEDTPLFDDYMRAVAWAQDYAFENRSVMLQRVVAAMRRLLPEFTLTQEAVNCHHNYVERENHFGSNVWITRKGAIRARSGDLGIIPGSMGQRSYIVRGLGNRESYHSCSHGAGRVMSRTKARELFTAADVVEQTQGVECRKDKTVVDEIPGAYKNIDEVMANQKDLVEVVHTLKQVLCVKG